MPQILAHSVQEGHLAFQARDESSNLSWVTIFVNVVGTTLDIPKLTY